MPVQRNPAMLVMGLPRLLVAFARFEAQRTAVLLV
jgi:hypothetical protein